MMKRRDIILIVLLIISIFLLRNFDSPFTPKNAEPCIKWFYAEGFIDFDNIAAISNSPSELREFFGKEIPVDSLYEMKKVNDKKGIYFFNEERLILLDLSSEKKKIYSLIKGLNKEMKIVAAGQLLKRNNIFYAEKNSIGFYPAEIFPEFTFIEI